MAIARSLVIDIAMNIAKITKDINKIRVDFDDLGSTVKKLGGVLATAFSVRAVINYADAIIDLGDELNKASQKVGISVEKLSAYQYAASLAGVSNEELIISLAKLSKNIQEAVIDKGSEAAKAFEALGVSAEKLKTGELSAIFEDVANKLSNVRNDTAKTTVEMELFGKSGYELAPLLNNLEELTKEAERTGNIISTDFAQKSEEFKDSITRMEKSLQRLSITLLEDTIPAMTAFFDAMTRALSGGAFFQHDQRPIIQKQVDVLMSFYEDALKNGQLQIAEGYRAQIDNLLRQMQKVNEDAKKALSPEKPKQKEIITLPEKVKAASGRVGRSEADDAFRAEAELSEGLTREGITKATEEIIAEEEKRRQAKMDAARGAILDEDTIAQEALDKRLENIQRARDLEIISENDKNILIQEAARAHQAAIGDIEAQGAIAREAFDKLTTQKKVETVLGGIMELTQGVAAGNKTLFQINKAAAIASAVISMPEHISKTMAKYPYPLSIAMGALAGAASLAQIQAIKSASFGSATSAPSVGGGGAIPVTSVGAAEQPVLRTESQLPSQNITINIQNGVGDATYWQNLIDEVIVPGINDASERNVNLNIRTV